MRTVLAFVGVSVCLAGSLSAVSIDAAYIFSSFSQPTNEASPPFMFVGEGAYGYELNLNPNPLSSNYRRAESVTYLGPGNDEALNINRTSAGYSPLPYLGANDAGLKRRLSAGALAAADIRVVYNDRRLKKTE